jgi:hypothetical protein
MMAAGQSSKDKRKKGMEEREEKEKNEEEDKQEVSKQAMFKGVDGAGLPMFLTRTARQRTHC